jgi:hypothetical protein
MEGGTMSKMSDTLTKSAQVLSGAKDVGKAAVVVVLHVLVLVAFVCLAALVSGALAAGLSALIPFVGFWVWFCLFMLPGFFWAVILSGGIAVGIWEKMGKP